MIGLRTWKIVGRVSLASMAVLIGTCITVDVITTKNRLGAKTTGARMVRISNYILADQPKSVDAAPIKTLLHK
jgi:hypothetical protein